MINRLINGLTILLIAVLALLSVLVTLNISEISQELNTTHNFSIQNPPNYHFMVILDGSDLSYVEEVEKGIKRGSKDLDIAYEMWYFDGVNKEEKIIEQFDIAIESNVDGIIIQPFKDDSFDILLNKANKRNIPVISIKQDIPAQEKVSFFSYNDYSIGNQIGNLLYRDFKVKGIDEGTIILLQEKNGDGSVMGSGIQEKLSPNFIIRTEPNEGIDALNAGGKTQNIISDYPDLVAIICSNGDESLSVVQTLKDINRINDIVVIANDDNVEILEYIRRGTVLASVVTDNDQLGYEAVYNLSESNDGLFVSQYKDIKIHIVNRTTIESYLKEAGDLNE